MDTGLVKLDPSGAPLWSATFSPIGGAAPVMRTVAAVDAEQNVYMVGDFRGTVDFDPDRVAAIGARMRFECPGGAKLGFSIGLYLEHFAFGEGVGAVLADLAAASTTSIALGTSGAAG